MKYAMLYIIGFFSFVYAAFAAVLMHAVNKALGMEFPPELAAAIVYFASFAVMWLAYGMCCVASGPEENLD